jgi:uncharacterized protein DUF3592
VSKLDKTLDVVEKGASRLQIGCWIIFGNLFLAAFCLWGAYAAYTSWRLQNEGQTTTGTVVRLEESSSSEGGCCVYAPVIEFNTNSQTYSFEGDNASDPPAYEVGEVVNVIYDPTDPSTAQINRWSERWLFPIIIIPAMMFTAVILNYFMIRAWIRGEYIGEQV